MMKVALLCVLAVLFTGCTAVREYETVMDEHPMLIQAVKKEIEVELPEEAVLAVFENESSERIYLCDTFDIAVITLESGDIKKTIRQVTGYSMDKLTVMETQSDAMKRYDCAWSACGEGVDIVGRTAVLDDGNYHYILSATADALKTEELRDCWNELFRSFTAVGTAA